MHMTRFLTLAAVWSATIIGSGGCGGDSSSTKPQAAVAPAPVTAVKAVSMDIADYRYYPGITQAVLEAEIVARVTGYLQERNFIEGDHVAAGQQLYLIQPQEYEADLLEAEAALGNANAQLKFARYTLEQTRVAFDGGAATVYEVDQATAAFEVAESLVETASAQLLNARLNLSYTKVIAPFEGQVGQTQVDVGNLVSPTENTTLATLVMLDPMRVVFEPAGTELVEFLKADAESTILVQVTVNTSAGAMVTFDGALDLVNNVVNQSTSTFLARGVFTNSDEYVLPGLYVSVRVRLRTIDGAVMIPDAAMHSAPTSQYIYVVGSNDELERRTVTIGVMQNNLRQITAGLKAGETVVVKGSPANLRQGVKVKATVVEAAEFVTSQLKTEGAANPNKSGSGDGT